MSTKLEDVSSVHIHSLRNGNKDEIVISGISGRFPESSNMEEFRENLMNGVDMVNDDPRRWPNGLYDVPSRIGKIKQKDLENFDLTFFGINQKQAEEMDPLIRALLEATHEAIIDSGYNPQDLRGSRTGVYVGVTGSEAEQYWSCEQDFSEGYAVIGCSRSMFANRISFAFDFCGPSCAMDTACSSGLYVMQRGFHDIRTGQCDAAIVAAVNCVLRPKLLVGMMKMNLLSPDGACKAFDVSANGFARSDGCVVMVLQKAKDARRVYSTILNVRSNTDGSKQEGITYPNGRMQKRLIEETFADIDVHPHDVVYVEAHGTGTKVGDVQEVNALCDFYCNDRKTPLLIGSVKSNMGHAETAAGMCSIAKMLIAMEEGIIPGNLHYKIPNPELYGIIDGHMKVVDENTPWNGGIIALNSIGMGGVNVHAVLKSNPKAKDHTLRDEFPHLGIVSGRTTEAVEILLTDIEAHANDAEYLALVNEIHTKDIPRHIYRGYTVGSKDGHVHEVLEYIEKKRPIWFIYTGVGCTWPKMAKDLMQIDVFSESIHCCAEALRPHGINLLDVMTKYDKLNVIESFVSNTALQVALTDVLRHIGIIPEGFLGHSVGEVACSYADGATTREEAVLFAYCIAKCLAESNSTPGSMVSVNLSLDDCVKRLPENIFIACINSANNVTISGPVEAVTKFIASLIKEKIFFQIIDVFGQAFHSKYIADVTPQLAIYINEIINYKSTDRTKKWISTTIPESDWETSPHKQSSGAYVINNIQSPVLFHQALQYIPENAICIEIGPHGMLQGILKQSLSKDVTNISLMVRNHTDTLQCLLSNIGKLYISGAQPIVSKLYRPVSFPVARGTPMLNSKIKWNHQHKFFVPYYGSSTSKETIVTFNLSGEDAFLMGHCVDGRIIFPATGYIILAWRQFAKTLGHAYNNLPVVIEDIVFHRATVLQSDGSVKFGINFFDVSGKFQICEGGSLCVSGIIRIPENVDQEDFLPDLSLDSRDLALNGNDFYKELRLCGYQYSGLFRGVEQADIKGGAGMLLWIDNNWITFMDTMLHLVMLETNSRELYLPMRIEKVIINPEKHNYLVDKYRSIKDGKVTFPAAVYKDMDCAKSGGIVLQGLTVSTTTRRQKHQISPKLEKCMFVPNYNNHDLSDNTDIAKESAIVNAVHIMIENSKGALRIKTIEILFDKTPEAILSTIVKSVIESEPTLNIDAAVVVTSKTPELEQLVNDTEIRITAEDTTTKPVESGCHLSIASDVLTCSNPELALAKLINSIKEDGFILLEESIMENGENSYNELFNKYNLVVVSTQKCSMRQFILLRPAFDVKSESIEVITVTENNFDWLEDLKTAISVAENENKLVYILSQGEELFGSVGFVACLRNDTGGKCVKLFFIQDCNAPPFSLSNPFYAEQIAKNLSTNVLKNGIWGSFRHLKLEYPENGPSKQVEHAYVDVLTKGDLSSLNWIEGPLCYDCDNSNYDICTVYYSALNYVDVMLTSGKLAFKETSGYPGIEFSGRDSKGIRVMAMVSSRSLATTCTAKKSMLLRVPDYWTLEQAATVPIAYSTAYYALVIRGKIKKGESILIHTGSGSVEQAAIRVALSAGLTVFTTAGSNEERDFLKQMFPLLQDSHIGNSQDCSFIQMIMRETGKKGVDLVLNSLAGDKLLASVKCLGINGRFLEIGKLNITNNKPLGMSIFIKNISFLGIHLDQLLGIDDGVSVQLQQLMRKGIDNGVVKPLFVTVFDDQQVEQAFRFMASGKHIGKVVIKMRDEEEELDINKPTKYFSALRRTYMDKRKTYVIVGGLGGFGLELINWLILRGAKNIVTISRSGIQTGYQSLLIRRWQEQGVNVIVSTSDITTQEGAEKVLNEANKLGPVGGIFNLAVVLRDNLFVNLKEADFRAVCLPKVNATKSLDIASRSLCPHLDYFICFSSAACGRGNVAQTNYGLGNSTMERICEARQVAGYPGTAIQWGVVGDTGTLYDLGDRTLSGLLPQRMASCLEIMDQFMQEPHPILASMVVAEKKKAIGTKSLTDCVANILGFKDLQKMSDTTNLVDLGMDSLMGAEVKQLLEREYDLMLNVQEIRNMTVGKLRSLEKEPTLKDATSTVKYISQQHLIPTEVLIRMQSGAMNDATQTPLFLIHPIEGTLDHLQAMAADLKCPVWGLQCTADVPLRSIADMAEYYIKEIKTIQSTGPYKIAGYSFGAAIAFEMAWNLENKLIEECSLFMLDGSPQYITSFRELRKNTNDESMENLESRYLAYFAISTGQSQTSLSTMTSELKKLSTLEEKIRKCVELVQEVTTFDYELIYLAAELLIKKLLCAITYQPSGKIKALVTLIKATTCDMPNVSEDFGLNAICEKEVKVYVVDGNHRSFLIGESGQKVAKILNKFI